MPRALGLGSRVLLIAVVLASAALVMHLHMDGLMSRAQLDGAVRDALHRAWMIAGPLARSPGALGGLAFFAGVGFGWTSALWWMGRGLRRRPLLIADLRSADMPLLEGIRHVRSNAVPPAKSDAAAMWLLLAEAEQGRLTLWRRASADTLRRVPRRDIRAAAVRMEESAAIESWDADFWQAVMLLSQEVERLWPRQRSVIIDAHALARVSRGRKATEPLSDSRF